MTLVTEDASALLEASFRSAEAVGPVAVLHLRIGGHAVLLRFAGTGTVPCVGPAFAHLVAEPDPAPELVIHVWDSASTGVAGPPCPSAAPGEAPGAFYFFEDPPVRGVFQPGMQALSVLDHSTDQAWYWVDEPGQLPYWERAAPLRQILHWWMATRGHQQVHAGAVGRPEGGVLLVGKGGSGKSTTSLVSLQSELRYAADDYAMVSLEPQPWVHSLYSSGKVHADNLHRVPHVAPALWNGDRLEEEKAVLFVAEHFPGRPIDGFPLRAIVLPTVTGRPGSRTVPVSPSAAMAALAPSTVFQLHTAGRETLSFLARLVRAVPAHVLELGTDVVTIPPAIEQLLDRIAETRT